MAAPSNALLTATIDRGVLVLTFTVTKLQDEKVADLALQEMLTAVEKSGLTKVVVDFQNVKYISSVAFRPLLSLTRKLQEVGGELLLCNLSQVVGDVFYTTRMVNTGGTYSAPFEIETDRATAVARLSQ